MNTLKIESLNLPSLVDGAIKLKPSGQLAISGNGLVYLDIDDAYIHQLFPLLDNQKLVKPDYFGIGLAGAHISVVYPEEKISVDTVELKQEHFFTIKDTFSAEIGAKKYCGLLVSAPSLLSIRRKYGLGDRLLFKGYLIDLHITVAVQHLV